MLYNGKFLPYVLILENEVGVFDLWPIDQHRDALKEFAGKGAAVHCVRTFGEEIELAEELGGAIWQIIHHAFSSVPFDEAFELGGRLQFCYLTSFQELSAMWEDVPDWFDLLRMNSVRN